MAQDARTYLVGGQLRRQALAAVTARSWGGLNVQLHGQLVQLAQVRRYPAGATIVAQGDLPPVVLWVVDGVARLVRRAPDGQELIVGLKMPMEIFGHARTRPLAFSLEAATAVTLLAFERPAFDALARENPDFARWLTQRYLDELDATREWMLLLGHRSIKARFSSFLIMLHLRRRGQPGYEGVAAPNPPILELQLSRRDIALCLRSTKESISRTIQSLTREGVIGAFGSKALVLSDLDRLMEISGDGIAGMEDDNFDSLL